MMSPGGFNVKVQVIPECVTLWHSHLICLRSSMKRPQTLSSPSGSWLQRGSPWLMGTARLCIKEVAWCPFLNSRMSSSLLTTSSFSSRDCPSCTKCSLPIVNPMRSDSLLSLLIWSTSQRLEQNGLFSTCQPKTRQTSSKQAVSRE